MALGAYSVVRYSDNFRDERVNVGVVVWHPTDGFACQFLPSFERIKAVNPSVRGVQVRRQIRMVEDKLHAAGSSGRQLMDEMSEWLKEGLEFSKPYPTRLTAARETATRLFDMLMPPAEPPQPVGETFEEKVYGAVRARISHIAPQSIIEEKGVRWIAGKKVRTGLHTRVNTTDLLWRTVSMRAKMNEDRIARAKSAAMDITKLRGLEEFDGYGYFVAIDSPAQYKGEALGESKRWLEDVGAQTFEIEEPDDLETAMEHTLTTP
jgi:hypothetical protein